MMNLRSHLSEQWKFIAFTRKWNFLPGELHWTQKGKFPPWSIWMHFLSPQWKRYTFIQCQDLDQRVSPVLIRMANFQLNKLTDHRDALMRKKKRWGHILILLSLHIFNRAAKAKSPKYLLITLDCLQLLSLPGNGQTLQQTNPLRVQRWYYYFGKVLKGSRNKRLK